MTDDRRLTTDRFFGGTSNRIANLTEFLAFVEDTRPSPFEATDWILSHTNANSRDAIDRHFGFLQAIGLINKDNPVTLGLHGQRYLDTKRPGVLYTALRTNVLGFDALVQALEAGSMTDEDIMESLVGTFDEFQMESPGVAGRHREWLQVLGYVEYTNGQSHLSDDGRQL